ncbi:MAG: STN domain-containing protein, partial [Candidatus Omnitrophica bacterium]|nr:STN domain-containing protein [Candidatus Omnitrophota bacterium]
MKGKSRVLSALIVLLYMTSLCAQEAPYLEDSDVLISMDLQNANLKDILKIFSIQSGLNFIASEAVQERKVTLYLDNVPIQEAMNKIFKANNLSYDLAEESNIFIVKDWGVPKLETKTKIYALKYRAVPNANFSKEKVNLLGGSAADLVTTIRQVMSDGGD